MAPATIPVRQRIARLTREDENGCWLWTGYVSTTGYANMKVRGKVSLAHRVSYEAFVGPIPAGFQIDHLCRVPSCVNPTHLEAVTPRENTLRSESIPSRFARRTHCKHGHPLDGIVPADGTRRCTTCHEARLRRRREAKAW